MQVAKLGKEGVALSEKRERTLGQNPLSCVGMSLTLCLLYVWCLVMSLSPYLLYVWCLWLSPSLCLVFGDVTQPIFSVW